jgi:3-oxoacyl-[acyl-carrier-protein] synthase II
MNALLPFYQKWQEEQGGQGGQEGQEEHKASYPQKAWPLTHLREFLPLAQVQILRNYYGFQGEQRLFTNACASGANAIGYAKRLINQKKITRALVGGYDPLSLFSFAGFHALKLMDSKPCAPFDRYRHGLNLGEGAGILILESESLARQRGIPILARVLGYGESADAFHLTQPESQGTQALRAMKMALKEGETEALHLDYINAHGTATLHNDQMESRALYQLVQDQVPISSTKGFTGHLLGGAGALEAVISILALQDQFLPANLGLLEPDPKFPPLRFVSPPMLPTRPLRRVLSNSFGFGGLNASLLFGSPSL